MEVIKKINSKKAWVKVGDTEAILMTFVKAKTDAEMIAAGQAIKTKRTV